MSAPSYAAGNEAKSEPPARIAERNADELLKKQRTRAAMLVLVGHRDSQFRALGGGGHRTNRPTAISRSPLSSSTVTASDT